VDDLTVAAVDPRPDVVDAVLRELPEWFGIESSIVEYVERSRTLPTYLATVDDDAVGVLVLEHHSPASAEMYLLGVRRAHHRRGVGRALVEAAERDLRANGTQFLQVKPSGRAARRPEYEATRRFYEALGYRPLQEFAVDELWDGNPCRVMVRHLACS
jgi:ribosomal protein S18 acetylase RimI-like enzyme